MTAIEQRIRAAAAAEGIAAARSGKGEVAGRSSPSSSASNSASVEMENILSKKFIYNTKNPIRESIAQPPISDN